jgi:flavodoxin
MQALVVYYSRSGNTKKVGDEIAGELKCDSEELLDTVNRSGPIGWLNSGRQASGKQLTKLKPIQKDPAKYDLVIIGTPVWARNVSTPVRTYLAENKDKLKNVAFFCTEGNTGDDVTFNNMEEACGKKPLGTLVVKVKDITTGSFADMAKKFAGEIKGSAA